MFTLNFVFLTLMDFFRQAVLTTQNRSMSYSRVSKCHFEQIKQCNGALVCLENCGWIDVYRQYIRHHHIGFFFKNITHEVANIKGNTSPHNSFFYFLAHTVSYPDYVVFTTRGHCWICWKRVLTGLFFFFWVNMKWTPNAYFYYAVNLIHGWTILGLLASFYWSKWVLGLSPLVWIWLGRVED